MPGVAVATRSNPHCDVIVPTCPCSVLQWARSGAILFLQYLRPCFWQGSLAVKLRMIHVSVERELLPSACCLGAPISRCFDPAQPSS